MYVVYRDNNDRLLGRYCGQTAPGPVESPRGAVGLRITLHTDQESVASGFKARYFFESAKSDAGDCGGNFSNQDSGIITSPNWPAGYKAPGRGMASNACNWVMTARPGYKLSIHFEQFGLEGDPASKWSSLFSFKRKFNFLFTSNNRSRLSCCSAASVDECGFRPAALGTVWREATRGALALHLHWPDGADQLHYQRQDSGRSGKNRYAKEHREINFNFATIVGLPHCVDRDSRLRSGPAVRGPALRVHVPLPVRSRILHLGQAEMRRRQELWARRRYWRIALWVVSESNGSVQFLFSLFVD